VAEVGDDVFHGFFHAVELGEFRVALDDFVLEDPGQAWIAGGVDQFRFADGEQHPLGRRGVGGWVLLTDGQVFFQAHLFFFGRLVAILIALQYCHARPLAVTTGGEEWLAAALLP